MDAGRFDSLTRRLAGASTRRATLRGAAALAAGGFGLAGASAADAKTRCRDVHHTCTKDAQCCSGSCPRGRAVPIHQRNRCACLEDTVLCNGECVPLGTDAHCSACGDACTGDTACCNGECIDICFDDANCGACGEACDVDEVCEGGICVPNVG